MFSVVCECYTHNTHTHTHMEMQAVYASVVPHFRFGTIFGEAAWGRRARCLRVLLIIFNVETVIRGSCKALVAVTCLEHVKNLSKNWFAEPSNVS